VRQLAAAAGVHHTYVSKLERGDRQAPDEPVVEALARAVDATPAQLDQLRWRAGLSPRGSGAPGQDDPTLTLVAEALGDGSLSPAARDRLRQAVARAVQGPGAAGPGVQGPGAAPWATGPGGFMPGGPGAGGLGGGGGPGTSDVGLRRGGVAEGGAPVPPVSAPAQPAPDGRASLLAGLLGGWQTLDEAAAELRVTAAYLWELIQGGYLRAWALPGLPPGTAAGVRLRREDVLALLQPVPAPGSPGSPGFPG
jgi:transcriptional regulator with XRE-family HTH domain